jgi:ABC-type nitrate/sulfonate/bicarbonate transport system substrate-binding protein
LFVSDRVLQARPKDVQAVVSALIEANDWWIAHTAEGNKIASEHWKVPLPEVDKTMSTTELYGHSQQAAQFGIGQPPQLLTYLDKCSALWLASGVIKAAVSGGSLIDAKFVKAALGK